MVTTLEVEVVDTATTQDTSLIASLVECFSSSPFAVVYHRCIIVFSSLFENHKTQKDFICFFWLFSSGHLSYASKNQKEQKYSRCLETNAKTEVQELLKYAHCFIFHFFSVTPIELKF